MSSSTVIEIDNLKFTYSTCVKPSLSGINLSVHKGEFVTLTGHSGCGKTTLCRCLNGLIPHFYKGALSGKIEVAKLNVLEHPTKELAKHVGFVSQNPENQLLSLSVERDIAFGLENLALPKNEIRERIDWALELTDITSLRDKVPHELSEGQKQRVAITSVLAMKPEILVLDEPTSYLDPVSAKNTLEMIERLHRELKLTIFLVEHRLDLVSKYTDRILIMENEEIKMDDEPEKIFTCNETLPLSLGIPKIAKLYQLLVEDGILSPPISLTLRDMTVQLRRALGE
ncbi:MAG: ATP-binding cassette domain-containing protein [Candidatus Bathyarchaeota archaeon]